MYNIDMKKSKAEYLYSSQKISALHRGIPFELTFEEWYNWWLLNGVDKNGPSQKQLGISRKDTLCMCRFNDTGPYNLDNIYCASASQNSKDMINRFSYKRLIQTPIGTFNSISDWSRLSGKSVGSFAHLREKYPNDYKYLNQRINKPHLN